VKWRFLRRVKAVEADPALAGGKTLKISLSMCPMVQRGGKFSMGGLADENLSNFAANADLQRPWLVKSRWASVRETTPAVRRCAPVASAYWSWDRGGVGPGL